MNNKQISDLANKWRKTSRGKFSDAGKEKTPFGKRFIEHGAMCYFNCANELSRLMRTEGNKSEN